MDQSSIFFQESTQYLQYNTIYNNRLQALKSCYPECTDICKLADHCRAIGTLIKDPKGWLLEDMTGRVRIHEGKPDFVMGEVAAVEGQLIHGILHIETRLMP